MIIKNIYIAKHSNDVQIPYKVSRKDFDYVITNLISTDCETVQVGDNKGIVRDWYYCFASPSFMWIIRSMAGFIPYEMYPSQVNVFTNEEGTLGNARVIKNPSTLFMTEPDQAIIFIGSFGKKENPVANKLKRNPSSIDFNNPHHIQYLEGQLMIIKAETV